MLGEGSFTTIGRHLFLEGNSSKRRREITVLERVTASRWSKPKPCKQETIACERHGRKVEGGTADREAISNNGRGG